MADTVLILSEVVDKGTKGLKVQVLVSKRSPEENVGDEFVEIRVEVPGKPGNLYHRAHLLDNSGQDYMTAQVRFRKHELAGFKPGDYKISVTVRGKVYKENCRIDLIEEVVAQAKPA